MSNEYSSLMATAVESTGIKYVSARDKLVADRAYERDLRGSARSQQDWESAWIARIVLGWQADKDLYRQAEEFIAGKLSGPRPITGKFSVQQRADAVAGLGDGVVPRLVEVVWKTREYPDDARLSTVFAALRNLAPTGAALPLRTLLDRETPPAYRHGAITTFGVLRDLTAAGRIRVISQDQKEDEQIRIAALRAVSRYDSPDLLPNLASVVRTSTEPKELRVAAAELIAGSSDPKTRETIHDLINAREDPDVLAALVDGLRDHGDDSSLPVLYRLREQTTDEELRQVIDDTIEWLEAD